MLKQKGFSLIEVLAVLVILGILMLITVGNLKKGREKLNFEEVVQTLTNDVRRIRVETMARGNPWRINIRSAHQYFLEEQVNGIWEKRQTRNLINAVSLSNVLVNDTISFNTLGFANFNLNGATPNEIHVGNSERTIRIVPAMTGAVRKLEL